MMTCLAACSGPGVRLKVDADCAWFRDQTMSPETKAWLGRQKPWPDYVRRDLDKIADNNDLAKAHCPRQ